MKRIISNIEHKMGSHCSSALIRDILAYNGLDISEALCFGIGAGLGFIYRKAFSPPYYFVVGRGSDLEDKVVYFLGGLAVPYSTDDTVKAWCEAKSIIDRNQPCLVNVDASCLSYLREKFNLFDNVRYGGHRLCIVGYDEEKGTANVMDYLWSETKEVSLSELSTARSSDAGQTPPNNLLYTFLFPEKFIDKATAIRNGIRMNIDNMRNPWYEVLGLPGIKKFTSRVMSWPRFMGEEMALTNAYMTYMMLEVVGTGGGNFRRLYSRFLREASPIIQNSKLLAIADIYSHLGGKWREIAHALHESSVDISRGLWGKPELYQGLLDEVYDFEERGILELHNAIL